MNTATSRAWAVTDTQHPITGDTPCTDCMENAESAVTTAKVTGSTGATHSTSSGQNAQTAHSATATRSLMSLTLDNPDGYRLPPVTWAVVALNHAAVRDWRDDCTECLALVGAAIQNGGTATKDDHLAKVARTLATIIR